MAVANFNVVFSSKNGEEQPLLHYFETIVIPALTSGMVKKADKTQYLLMNVEVVDVGENEYAIVGNIVKSTTLEVFSQLDEDGNLVELDDKYPTAPFSTFSIYLKNHRMVFVQNQNGSPTLRNFESTVRHIITRYVKYQNQERKQLKMEEYPEPLIYVVGIPMRESIEESLKQVKKINRLTLRFYPLNGDLDFSGMFNGMTTELRRMVDSKNGEIVLKTPKSISGITEVLEQAGGTVDPIFNVTYPNNNTGRISNDEISERMEIDIQGENRNEELTDIAKKGRDMKAITYVSESNNNIYKENMAKIIPFVKRKI